MRISFFLFIFLHSFLSSAQFQTNTWLFGEQAAIRFNGNQVSNLSNGPILYNEGLSSISDCRGNLIMYSNSENLYNSNHTIIKNGDGLMGSHSTTQGALIVPLPQSCNRFYLFTLDDKENDFNDGLRYNIIDMSANDGNGEVISKNNLLYTRSTEKMCATHHTNGEDIWIITHEYTTNNFYAYLLTKNGIDPNPIISSVGPDFTFKLNSIGQMKASIDGKKIAFVNMHTGAGLLDFDNSTGQISNYVQINQNGGYGVEFSPDGTKLYTSFHAFDYLNSSGALYQFDLTSGNETIINQSKTFIGKNAVGTDMRGLQLGPDGKIYVARSLGKHLGVIHDPNTLGISCNYIDSGFSLNNKICLWTFPSFVSSMIFTEPMTNHPDFSFELECAGMEINFTNLSQGNDLEYEWSFGDGNTSTLKNPSHAYATKGKYNIILRTTKKCCTEEVRKTILIPPCPDHFFIPTAFSPNGDGLNDTWRIMGNTITSIRLCIYNRWGQMVFNTSSLLASWDGTFFGEKQATGTYSFTAELEFQSGEKKNKHGMITLLR